MEALETYGVDWEALDRPGLINSQIGNNSLNEGSTTWHGRRGPPERSSLSHVEVESLDSVLTVAQEGVIAQAVSGTDGRFDKESLQQRWLRGLAAAQVVHPAFMSV
jgi:hypothetical protein